MSGELAVGVGLRPGTEPAALLAAVREVLAGLVGPPGAAPPTVGVLATLDARVAHPAVRATAAALGVAVRGFPAPALAARAGGGSAVVVAAVGTPAVAEPAALLAAAPHAVLVVARQVRHGVTVAVAGPDPG